MTQPAPDLKPRSRDVTDGLERAAARGMLRAVGHRPTGGRTPRNFNIDPTGQWLIAAHQNSGNVVALKIDPTTGLPAPVSHQVSVPRAVCVKFLMK